MAESPAAAEASAAASPLPGPDQAASEADPAVTAGTSAADEAAKWTRWVSPEGYPYFHNQETGETVWVEPECVRLAREVSEAEAALEEEREWEEAAKRDAERKARKEARLKAEAEKAAAQAAAELAAGGDGEDAEGGGMSTSALVSDMEQETNRTALVLACARLQQLFLDCGARAQSSWESLLPRLAVDPRFTEVPSLAMRRRIFTWWCRRRAEDPEAAAEDARQGAAAATAAAESRWATELREAAADGRLSVPGLTFEAFRAATASADGRAAADVIGPAAAREAFTAARGTAFAAAEAERAAERAAAAAREAERRERARGQASEAFRAVVGDLRWLTHEHTWQDVRSRREDGSLAAASAGAGGDAGPREAMGAGLSNSGGVSRPPLGKDPRWCVHLSEEDMQSLFAEVKKALQAKGATTAAPGRAEKRPRDGGGAEGQRRRRWSQEEGAVDERLDGGRRGEARWREGGNGGARGDGDDDGEGRGHRRSRRSRSRSPSRSASPPARRGRRGDRPGLDDDEEDLFARRERTRHRG